MTKPCLSCGGPLTFGPRGWVHTQGGTYMMRCDACGYRAAIYPSPRHCPQCEAVRAWRDDHCATPAAEARHA